MFLLLIFWGYFLFCTFANVLGKKNIDSNCGHGGSMNNRIYMYVGFMISGEMFSIQEKDSLDRIYSRLREL